MRLRMNNLVVRANVAILCAMTAGIAGCGGTQKTPDKNYYTSGSREADQRAEQRMAKADLDRGGNEKNSPTKKSLYERLGGEQGLAAIVDDWVSRAMNDARVNWRRTGIATGHLWNKKSMTWNATPQAIAAMKQHIGQFIANATGGPTTYTGKNIKDAHFGMQISNPEFDAAIGDLKASLDKLQVGVNEQKELIAICESTRPQIVEKR